MRAAILAVTVATIALAGFLGSARAEPIASARVHVLDGDTIRVDGRRPDVRLVGFNAPETTRRNARPNATWARLPLVAFAGGAFCCRRTRRAYPQGRVWPS